MLRFPAPAAVLAAALAAAPAQAALITDVADAADKDDPIDLNLDLRWRRAYQSAKIVREFFDSTKNLSYDATELVYQRTQHVMDLNITLGLYHDLELRSNIPYMVSDEQTWGYASVNGASVEPTSSIANNRINANGDCLSPDCGQAQPLLPSPGSSLRGGWMDPSFGIAWGILGGGPGEDGRSRDEQLPEKMYPPRKREADWVIGFDYTMPVTKLNDPSRVTAASPVTLPVGQGTHRFDWWMAMSKRVGIMDPFLKLHYTLPIASDRAYDNCATAAVDTDSSLTTTALQKTCAKDQTFDATGYWFGKTGLIPQHRGGVVLGTEAVPIEDKARELRLSIGLQVSAEFVSKGRTYTELSDALRKLTYSDQYFTADARLTSDLRFSKWVHWVSFVSFGAATPHFVTNEFVGKDQYGAKPSDPADGQVTLGTSEVNPNYDFRLDQPNRRFKVDNVIAFAVSSALSINF